MADEISPNKVSDAEKRRAEHIESKLKKQGMGEDEAEKRALAAAVEEDPRGRGGGNSSGNNPKKGTNPEGDRHSGNTPGKSS
ncbi:MAG TPA: hypothetical protein VF590_09815 [Isosphaeraceae bacterium]